MALCETFVEESPASERERLRQRLKEFKATLAVQLKGEPLLLVHGDPCPQNVLLTKEGATFVDFEYSGTSWAQWDLAEHFTEWVGLELRLGDFPTAAEQEGFVRVYLKERFGREPTAALVAKWVSDVNALVPFESFLWGAWGIFQAAHSQIKFSYDSYTQGRFAMVELKLPLPAGHALLAKPLVDQAAPEE
jgi:thiamine kinase-like enzyme